VRAGQQTTMTATTPNPDPLMTVDEAAEYLGMSAEFVRRQVAAGRLEGTRLGRYLRIRQSALERYLSVSSTASEEG
jgi:excisionase family DNA binding protein